MSPNPSPSVSPATDAQVIAAIEAIYRDQAKLLKLNRYANVLAARMGRAAESRDGDDLLQEAVTRTLEGQRKWNSSSVDVVGHLIGVMDSIASHATQSVRNRGADTYNESEVINLRDDGSVTSAIEQHACVRPLPDQVLSASSQLRQIREAFSQDDLVTRIIDQMATGVTDGPSIRSALSLSQNDYETGMRRLRRRAQTLNRGASHV